MLKNRELQAYAELCTEGRRVPDDEDLGEIKRLEMLINRAFLECCIKIIK